LSPLQIRLIDANLKRRNRFLYAQQHSQRLGGHPRNRPRERPALAMRPQRSELSNTAPHLHGEALVREDPGGQSTTTATALDEQIQIPAEPVNGPATTVLSVTSSRITYPKAPPLHNRQILFTCPCCCQSLPVAVGRGNQWK
jgi:hypothetical protein